MQVKKHLSFNEFLKKVITVIKRTGILLYRGNLNKNKIYTRRIFNTDRNSLLQKEEKVEDA